LQHIQNLAVDFIEDHGWNISQYAIDMAYSFTKRQLASINRNPLLGKER
jgi:hypothetical protein